jgi:hypothetical protein
MYYENLKDILSDKLMTSLLHVLQIRRMGADEYRKREK